MATPTYYLCDKCGKETRERLFVPTGRQMDGAGSMETVGDNVDLCNKCAMRAVNLLLGTPQADAYGRGQKVIAWARSRNT